MSTKPYRRWPDKRRTVVSTVREWFIHGHNHSHRSSAQILTSRAVNTYRCNSFRLNQHIMTYRSSVEKLQDHASFELGIFYIWYEL